MKGCFYSIQRSKVYLRASFLHNRLLHQLILIIKRTKLIPSCKPQNCNYLLGNDNPSNHAQHDNVRITDHLQFLYEICSL